MFNRCTITAKITAIQYKNTPVISSHKKRFFRSRVEKNPSIGARKTLTQNKEISKEKFSLRTFAREKSGSMNEPITGNTEISTTNNSAPDKRRRKAFCMFFFTIIFSLISFFIQIGVGGSLALLAVRKINKPLDRIISRMNLIFYALPEDMQGAITEGTRVLVQFGKKKIYSAIVYKLHEKFSSAHEIKSILSFYDDASAISKKQLELWQWIASYYMCSLGEVFNAAVPSVFKLESETSVFLNPDFDEDVVTTDYEEMIVQALQKKQAMTMNEVDELISKRSFSVINKMIENIKNTFDLIEISSSSFNVFKIVSSSFNANLISVLFSFNLSNLANSFSYFFSRATLSSLRASLLSRYCL